MKHALIEAATPDEIKAAEEAADWMLDAVATATQDRRFLRGEDDYDDVIGEAILVNAKVCALRAVRNISLTGSEISKLRACLEATRDEICEGSVDGVLWHNAGITTVDNITYALNDGWTYDGWAEAKSTQA